MAFPLSRTACAYLAASLFLLSLVIFYAAKRSAPPPASPNPKDTAQLLIELMRAQSEERKRERAFRSAFLGKELAEQLEKEEREARTLKFAQQALEHKLRVKRETREYAETRRREDEARITERGRDMLKLFEKAALERIRRKPTSPPRTLFELNAIFYDGLCRDREDEVAPKTHDPEYLRRANAESALNIPNDIQLDGYILLLVDEHIENALENTRMEYKEDSARQNLKWISKHTLDMKNPE